MPTTSAVTPGRQAVLDGHEHAAQIERVHQQPETPI
jgi:hypothetical protein